jgi:hypothetical protein
MQDAENKQPRNIIEIFTFKQEFVFSCRGVEAFCGREVTIQGWEIGSLDPDFHWDGLGTPVSR